MRQCFPRLTSQEGRSQDNTAAGGRAAALRRAVLSMGSKQGKQVNSAFLTHSTFGLGICSSGNKMNVFASSLKQSRNPSDKPLISSSLGSLPWLIWLALISLHYREEANKGEVSIQCYSYDRHRAGCFSYIFIANRITMC